MTTSAAALLALASVAFTPPHPLLGPLRTPGLLQRRHTHPPTLCSYDDVPGDSEGSDDDDRGGVTFDSEVSADFGAAPDRMAMGWQEELERLLSPATSQADREVLLKDLLSRSPEIAAEVQAALGAGDLASLVPPDGEGARVLDEIGGLQRQLLDDLIPQAASEASALLSDPNRLASTVQRAAAEAPEIAQDAASASTGAVGFLSRLLQDPAKATALVQQQTRNALSRTPEGLEMPRCARAPRACALTRGAATPGSRHPGRAPQAVDASALARPHGACVHAVRTHARARRHHHV